MGGRTILCGARCGAHHVVRTGVKVTNQQETSMKRTTSKESASQLITKQIAGMADWRGKMLARLRKLINETDPELTEEYKWGTPVWSRKGNVVALGAFKEHIKINFFKGASLDDPKGLFNAGLDAKATRAIDIVEGGKVDEGGLKQLIRAAVVHDLGLPPR
jgi:hypothetical protein